MQSCRTRLTVALALLLWVHAGLAAQDTSSVAVDSIAADTTMPSRSEAMVAPAHDTTFTVDRVLAIVGNRPVLASQVEEEIFSREAQGTKLPTSPEGMQAVRQQVVGSIIDEELLVQQAQRDTAIKVTDEEIASGVEEQVRKVRGNFTSEVDYRAELQKAGFQTPEE